MSYSVADHEVPKRILVGIRDQPDRSGPRLVRFAPPSLESAKGFPFALSVHPKDFDGMVGFVGEDDVELIAVRFRGRRCGVNCRMPFQFCEG